MKADGGYVFQTLTLIVGEGLDLLLGKIALIGTTEVQLITILLCFHRAKDRTELWQFNLSDTCQLVVYLFLFELQLLLVGQVLPLAATTNAEVFTKRYRAYITIFNKAHHLAFGKGVFLAPDLYVTHVARHAERHKYHQFFPVEQTFALSSHGFYCYALKER